MRPAEIAFIWLTILLCVGCQQTTEQPVLWRQCSLDVALELPRGSSAPVLVSQQPDTTTSRYAFQPEAPQQWSISVPLPTGRTLYWIESDGAKYLDPANPLTQLYAGAPVSVAHIDDCENPAIRFVQRTGSWDDSVLTLVLARAQSGAPLEPQTIQARTKDGPLETKAIGDHIYVSTARLALGKHTVLVDAEDSSGRRAQTYRAPLWIEPQVFRWTGALIYQIVIDRFAGDTNLGPRARAQSPGRRAGGTIAGVTRKLESGYFDALGVSALWLSPLYKNPDGLWRGVEGGPPRYESYHGYWPIEPRALDSRLGSDTDLETLVAAAHERGIRIIVDVVPNHVHQEHVYLQEHPEWFSSEACICGTADCPWWKEIETCWFTPYLPDVDWAAEGALNAFVDDMAWWIKRFDLDGLRVDAVPMIPRFVTRHLASTVHQRFEQGGTRHYLLGETFTGPEGHASIRYPLGAHGLDGQFDFPWMWALRAVLAWETESMEHLVDVWSTGQESWRGSASVMATMIGNHDVTRFASEAHARGLVHTDPWSRHYLSAPSIQAHERHRLAQVMVLTLPGAPVLYYGDEFGQAGGRDPDNRRPMRFGGELDENEQITLLQTQRLGRLRFCMNSLKTGTLDFVQVESEAISYLRYTSTEDWAFIEIRRAAEVHSNRLAPKLGHSWSGTVVDILSDQRITVENGALSSALVSPYTARVLIPEGHPCLPSP